VLLKYIKKILNAIGWGDPAYKDTYSYLVYLRLFHNKLWREYINEYESEHVFYHNLLKGINNCLVFDVGANGGFKTNIFRRLAGKVVCVEPDLHNFNHLRKRFMRHADVVLVGNAVGDKQGKEVFYCDKPGSALNTLSKKWKDGLKRNEVIRFKEEEHAFSKEYLVDVVTLDMLIKQYGLPYYIKIDVEGYELNVLKGLSSCVNVISFEVNLPEFKAETIECVSILNNLCGNYKFNVAVELNNDLFKFNNWMNSAEFKNFIAITSMEYFEVFAHLS